MFNKTIIVGRLTKDVEIVTYSKGQFAKLRIAQSSKLGNKEENLFIDVLYFTKNIELVKDKLNKGRLILVEGRLTQDKKTNKISIIASNIVFLEKAVTNKGKVDKTNIREEKEEFDSIPNILSDEDPF